MAPSGALVFYKRDPLFVTSGSVSGYYFLLIDVFGPSVALMQSFYWGRGVDIVTLLGPT